MISLVSLAIALLGTTVTAWQDYRTGYLSDKITVAMIACGVLLVPFTFSNPVNVYLIAIAVFLIGFAGYAYGQIGGGDVLLLTGLSLLIPPAFWQPAPYPPVVSIFVTAGIASTMFFTPLKNHYRLFRKKKEIDGYRSKIIKGFALGLVTVPLFIFYSAISFKMWVLFPFFALGFSMIPFKNDILRLFCIRMKKVSKMDEEEVLALEFISDELKKTLGLKRRTLLGKELEGMKEKAKEAGIKELPVCENLPVFVPAILFGLIVFLLIGDPLFYILSP